MARNPTIVESDPANEHDPGSRPARNSPLSMLAPWLGIIASWALFRPYPGIVHDARLYVHFARFRAQPGFADTDLLVAFDEQMSRSIYVSLITPLIDAIGIARAGAVAAVTGLIAWIAGIAALGRVVFDRDWWILVVIAPAFPAHWGPLFSLAEPFAAPRALAEGLVLGAVALALSRRFLLAVPVLAIALALHPLVALPGVAVIAVLGALVWRPLVPVLVAGTVVGIGILLADPLGIAGTDSYDPAWLEIIAGRAFLVLPGEWNADGWVLVALGFVLVAAAAVSGSTEIVRRLSRASGIVGFVAMAISLSLAWLWIVPLAVQLQPWRALWIVHVVSIVAVVDFGLVAWRTRSRSDLLRAIAAAGLAIAAGVNVPIVWFVAQLIISIPFLAPSDTGIHRRVAHRPLALAMVASSAGLLIAQCINAGARLVLTEELTTVPWIGYTAALPGATLAIAFAIVASIMVVLRLDGDGRKWPALALGGLVVFVVAAATVTWDHRTEWQAFVESVEESVIELPDEALVAIEDDTIGFVTLLQRPGYYSNYAAAGVAFSHDMAFELQRRGVVARSLGVPWALDWEFGVDAYEAWSAPSVTAVRAACSVDGGPTHLFLRRPVAGLDGIVWTAPVAILGFEPAVANPAVLDDAFVLYSCADL